MADTRRQPEAEGIQWKQGSHSYDKKYGSVKLAEDGRITEITRAASDRSYLEQLLKEYGITKNK